MDQATLKAENAAAETVRQGRVISGNTLVILFWTAAAWPSLVWFARRTADGSDEPLGLVALAAGLWFMAREKPVPSPAARGLALGCVPLLLSAWPGSPALLSALLAILSLAFAFGLPGRAPGITALLGLSLPWMASLDFYLGAPFREMIALAAAGILRAVGLPVEAVGAVIELAGRPVAVDPPCTGLGMLWHALFAASALAAFRRLALGSTLKLIACAALFALAGNVARATTLFFPEAGLVDWPSWTHETIGLVWFLPVILLLVLIAARGKSSGSRRAEEGNGATEMAKRWWMAAAVGAVLLSWWPGEAATHPTPVEPTVWPDHWEGMALIPLEPDEMEKRFARGFPGEIRRFHFDGGQLILRRVHRATRMLHSSADCLRAAGCRLLHQPRQLADENGAISTRYTVSDPVGGIWEVSEWVVSDNGSRRSASVSSWYWSALRSPEDGPWMAMTVMRKVG